MQRYEIPASSGCSSSSSSSVSPWTDEDDLLLCEAVDDYESTQQILQSFAGKAQSEASSSVKGDGGNSEDEEDDCRADVLGGDVEVEEEIKQFV